MNFNCGAIYRSRIHGGLLTVIEVVYAEPTIIMDDTCLNTVIGYRCLMHDDKSVWMIFTHSFNMDWEPTREFNKTVKLLYGDK